MNENFYERLNQIKDRLASPELLSNAGLGNEIGFYIFDYPPERELAVRRHLEKVLPEIPCKIAVVNLFELLVEYLKTEKMLEDAVNLQCEAGDAELLNAFKGIIEGARIAPLIAEKALIETHDAVILTGIGNAFPLIRTHDLLNNLQILMNNKPLVVFYPGVYSGQNLSLFGKLRDENYYRAFRLVV
ncbi:MAG: DUF1788 domain-containing protein [Pyrinomonadaceae bacterium]|nr:DUF1788 domain-containing protein [Pyrinomonadaceae bacterium]